MALIPQDIVESIHAAARIEEVIEDHLVADSSVDLFLSGGIDSSIIASLTQKFSGNNFKTFSIIDTDKRYNETKLINENIKFLKLKKLLQWETSI